VIRLSKILASPAEKGQPAEKEDILRQKPPSLVTIIEEAQDLPKERRGFLRPSAILGCDRQQVFRILGAPKGPQKIDNKLQRILDNGTAVHSVVQGYLARHHDWWFAPEARVYQEVGGILIKGSCDGIMVRRRDGYRFGIEIKTINHNSWLALAKPDPKHVFQASIYAVLHKVWWIVIYYWDKDKQEHKEYPVCCSKERWREVTDRVAMLRVMAEKAVQGKALSWINAKREFLPSVCLKTCDQYFCDYCDFCFYMRA
jgi:hypothetical protein